MAIVALTALLLTSPAAAQDAVDCDDPSATAVSDRSNTGLMADCKALLEAKDTLRGTVTLNWSADTSITQWTGVTTSGTPKRVTHLKLGKSSRGDDSLNGRIPAQLGSLTKLQILELYNNRLTGQIPTELGRLSNLSMLDLSHNRLTGGIPEQLGDPPAWFHWTSAPIL